MTVASRTYSQTDTGTYGQYLAAEPIGWLLDTGDSAILMQLHDDDAFRTNIGLTSTWTRAARVNLTLYTPSGTPLSTIAQDVPAMRTVQLLRPFQAVGGAPGAAGGYAPVELVSGRWVAAYASVVDTASSDPTTIPMKRGAGSATQWVAAAAHADGAFGSQWRTDLALLNRSGDVRAVEVTLHDQTASPARLSLVLAPGEQRVLDDIAGRMGRAAGALEVTADGPVFATSRTSNVSASGTLGQFLDGWPPERAIHPGRTAWLPLLREDDAYRSNIGLLNVAETRARVVVRLFDASGNELGQWLEELEPRARRQVNQPFRTRAQAAAGQSLCATVTVEPGGGSVAAYASVVDNLSNDPTTVPMAF